MAPSSLVQSCMRKRWRQRGRYEGSLFDEEYGDEYAVRMKIGGKSYVILFVTCERKRYGDLLTPFEYEIPIGDPELGAVSRSEGLIYDADNVPFRPIPVVNGERLNGNLLYSHKERNKKSLANEVYDDPLAYRVLFGASGNTPRSYIVRFQKGYDKQVYGEPLAQLMYFDKKEKHDDWVFVFDDVPVIPKVDQLNDNEYEYLQRTRNLRASCDAFCADLKKQARKTDFEGMSEWRPSLSVQDGSLFLADLRAVDKLKESVDAEQLAVNVESYKWQQVQRGMQMQLARRVAKFRKANK